MKAQELRLKNLLKRGDDIIEVSAIFKSHFNCINVESGIDYGNNEQNNFNPIPLTEEWLVRFGFEYIGDEWHYNGFNFPCYLSKTGLVIRGLNAETHVSYVKINYIHQLQNLYFALTGEELSYEQ